MAHDLRMEMYAYDIFQTAFLSHRLIRNKVSVFQIYRDECHEDSAYAEACDDLFHKAIFCRRELFQTIYKAELMYEKIESCKSPSDLSDYLIHQCDQDYLFHNLNVFERMFATCAFVVTMCVHIYWYNVVDVINYGHLFWAKAFDRYAKEFYKEGGWTTLKRVANTYDALYDFLALFPENFDNYLSAIKEATVNYQHFKGVSLSKDSKHVSKMWVRFHIENFGNYIKIPASYEISLNPVKREILLEELKQFCDPLSEDFKYSEQFRDSGSKVKSFIEFASRTDDSSNCISKERCQDKRVNEFASITDDSSSNCISTERCQDKRFNEFVLITDGSYNSVHDSDRGNMSLERHRRSDFLSAMVSETLKTCSEMIAVEAYLQFRSFCLAYKNQIGDVFNGKLSNSSIEYNEQLPEENSVLNSEAVAFDHLRKNENLGFEEKTINEKVIPTNTSELSLNVYSLNKHNILAAETTSEPFKPSTEKSPNTESLDFGHGTEKHYRNLYNDNEINTTNDLHPRNIIRKSEIVNVVEDILANQTIESVREAKSPLKNFRTQKQLNPVNGHISIVEERKDKKTVDDYLVLSEGKLNEIINQMDILFTKLNATSECNAQASPDIDRNLEDVELVDRFVNCNDGKESNLKIGNEIFNYIKREINEIVNLMITSKCYENTSSNITHYTKDFYLLNAILNDGDRKKIIERRMEELRNDQEFNQFFKTLLKLEGMEANEYLPAKLFCKEELLENSPESLKNPKKRTRNEQESCRKKYSPERKESEN